jgi:hypothetical protein
MNRYSGRNPVSHREKVENGTAQISLSEQTLKPEDVEIDVDAERVE